MQQIKDKKAQGFTLIEVVLVLAIGGLIFLLAFLAFQQVSKNRRDTQRRSDVSRIVAEISNYTGDNGGNIPTAATATAICAGNAAVVTSFNQFVRDYMCRNGVFKAPNGTYSIVTTAPTGVGQIQYSAGYSCAGASLGNVTVRMKLESGIVCRDDL